MMISSEYAQIAAATAAKAGTRVYARVPLSYDGPAVDAGAVFALKGLVNDRKLITSDLIRPLEDAATAKCPTCKGEFVANSLRVHVNRQHPKTKEAV
jgi:hypothetical protein